MSDAVIVEAVGIVSGKADLSNGGTIKSDFAKIMEKAMTDAVLKAHADGLANDPDAIKQRIEEARATAKAQYGT